MTHGIPLHLSAHTDSNTHIGGKHARALQPSEVGLQPKYAVLSNVTVKKQNTGCLRVTTANTSDVYGASPLGPTAASETMGNIRFPGARGEPNICTTLVYVVR